MDECGKTNLVGDISLLVSLKDKKIIFSRGFENSFVVTSDGLTRVKSQYSTGSYMFFLSAVFFSSIDEEKILNWLNTFDPDTLAIWTTLFDCEFSLIVWQKFRGEIICLTDTSSTQRLYVSANNGKATITDSFLDQFRLQIKPQLGGFGFYTMLTLNYPFDPYTPLKNTYSVTQGFVAKSDGITISPFEYKKPFNPDAKRCTSVAECVQGLENSIRNYFSRRINEQRVPVVMVSGGIDSLVMLRYAKEVAPTRVETVTFAFEGQSNSELEEGAIAADYYGVKNNRWLVPQASLIDSCLEVLAQGDNAAFYAPTMRELTREDGRPLDIFRGEDTRLHTPMFDWSSRIGIYVQRLCKNDRSPFSTLWNTGNILKLWPLRKGSNYIKYILWKTEVSENLQLFALQKFLRYKLPTGVNSQVDYYRLLFEETASLANFSSIDSFYRQVISIAYRVQFSGDMLIAKYAHELANSKIHFPFYDSEVVSACNRIPFRISTRPILVSPLKTRSPFFLADKYILRKLMARNAPEELLYRRKAAPSADDIVHPMLRQAVFIPVIKAWGNDLLRQLDEDMENRTLVEAILRCVIEEGASFRMTPLLAKYEKNIVYLCVLAHLAQNNICDIREDIISLNPEILDSKKVVAYRS